MILRPSRLIRSPRRRTRSAEVEPEPKPTIIPSRTKAAAAWAARDLGDSLAVGTTNHSPCSGMRRSPASRLSGNRTRLGATRFELVTSCSQGRRANQAALRPAFHWPVACYAGHAGRVKGSTNRKARRGRVGGRNGGGSIAILGFSV